MVLTVEGDWDSYAWESCIYGAWSDWPGDGPSLTLSKEEFVTRAYRCTVTKGEQSVTSQVFAYNSAALEPPGNSLLASGDLSAENSYMRYGPSQSQFSYPHLFDIQGRDNGSEIRTTYADTGYRTAIEVDGSKVDVRYQEGATTAAGSLTAETDLSFAYGGRYVKITYTVTNNGSTTQDFQIGSSADVMIGNNDHAEVVGTETGLSMNGLPKNEYQFQLVAPDCDTLWYGYYTHAYRNMFTDLTDKETPYHLDSGMAWSWNGAVAPGATWTRYVLVGVGDLPLSPAAPTLGDIDTTWTRGETVTVFGTVTGENAADMVYVNFNGTEYSSPVDNEGRFSVNVKVPDDIPEGKSSFTYWSGTDEGGISKIQSQEVTIVAMPQLTLTTHSVTVMEDEVLADTWLQSFIQSSAGKVTTVPLIIDTGKLGDTIVTYTASNEGFTDATATLTVTVLPQPAALGSTTVSGPEDGPYTLTAAMEYTGGNTWTETGFVYGVIPNPTLSLCDGSVTTSSPVSSKGEQLTATVDADSLAYDGQTITQMVTVSNIDTAAPTATIQDLTNTTHTQAVTLTVAVSDGQSGVQTVTGTWSSGSDIRTAALTNNGGGNYTTTSPDESGDWKLFVTATDHAGNTGTDTSTAYRINATRPTLTVDETSRNQRGVTYSYSVEANGNTGITVSLPDGSTTDQPTGSFTITEPGTYTISVTDDAGHFVSKTVTVAEQADNPLDGAAPDVRLSIESEAWTKDSVTVTVSVYDAGSENKPLTAYLGGQAITLTESSEETGSFTGSFTVSTNGAYTVTCTDAATNMGSGEITIANIDDDAPGIEVSGNPADWTANDVTITLTVTDGQSGVDSVTVKKGDGGVSVSGSSGTYTFTATENGTYTVTATDAVGNSASEIVAITRIDKNPPTISVTGGDASAAQLTLTVTTDHDGGSDVTVTAARDGGEPQEVEGGTYTVTAPGTYTFTATTGAGMTAAETVTVHQVTFASAYGAAPGAVLVQSGGTVSEPAAPTCAGCTFAGWYQGSADTAFDFNTPITANLTLTAHWTLDLFGVQITGETRGTYNGGEPVVTLTANTSHAAGNGVIYTYQWYKENDGGVDTPVGTNSAALTLADVADSGSYYVEVTADGDILTGQQSATSAPVAVTIGPKPLTVTWSGLEQTFGSFDETSVKANLDGVAGDDAYEVTYTFSPANPLNAGTYKVTAALTGADAGSYTLTDHDATLTIEKQTVYFTVADNTVQAGTTPNVTVTPSEQGAAGSCTVTYRCEQNGQTAVSSTPPTESGQYEIWVTFDKDGNYQAAGGLEQQVGTLTVTERPPVTYTVTFAAGGGSTADAPDPLTAVSGSTVALPANPFTYSGHRFIGWSDGSRLWQPGGLYPVTRDVTLTAQWRAVYEIDGIVEQEPTGGGTPEPVPAVVTLMYGGR